MNLLDTKQLAKATGVSSRSLMGYARDGRIPYVEMGARRRYDLAKVQAAMAAEGFKRQGQTPKAERTGRDHKEPKREAQTGFSESAAETIRRAFKKARRKFDEVLALSVEFDGADEIVLLRLIANSATIFEEIENGLLT